MQRHLESRRLLCAALCALVGCGADAGDNEKALPVNPTVQQQESGTSVLLQAVSVVNDNVVWVSGHGATFARTVDGGNTWSSGIVAGPDTLQFRDVHAVDAETAYLLSAGPGDMSRIYKTSNAGVSWDLQFTNTDSRAFFDCMDFWDAERGLAFSDAVDGRLIIIRTTNGRDWTPVSPDAIPHARGTEGGFAASGTCLVTRGERRAWIGTGAGEVARIFRTADGGDSWTASETPVVSGTGSSGITSLVFRDEMNGFAFGGDISDTASRTDNVAVTQNGGATWILAGRPVFPGAVYGATTVPSADGMLVVVGPQGLDYSSDDGSSWTSLDTLNYWAVAFASPSAGWAVGPAGRIAKIGMY